jgi:hypothetical protein
VRRIAAAAVVALALPAPASASFLVDRNASGVSLKVSGGSAIVNYQARGSVRHVVLTGAVNARRPDAGVPQVTFRAVYGSGAQAGGACRPYDGPALPLLVAACDAPDGSHWALQSWQRLLSNYGGTTAPYELQASHWTGELPKLEVWVGWSYGGRFQHLFGRYTYVGNGVHGFRSTRYGSPLDAYGRNLYLDTLDSAYGSGWRRENSFLAHSPNGVFCYGFYPHRGSPGTGSAYRLTAQGPGVTPVVMWSGSAAGGFDTALDDELNALQRSLGDSKCRQN